METTAPVYELGPMSRASRLFEAFLDNPAISWKHDGPTGRNTKIVAAGRASSITEATYVRQSEYLRLPQSYEMEMFKNRPNKSVLRVIQESFDDGRLVMSLEVLRSTRANLLVLEQRLGSPETAFQVYDWSGQELERTVEIDDFVDNLIEWSKSGLPQPPENKSSKLRVL